MTRLIAILSAAALASAAEPPIWKQLPPLPDALGVAAPFAGVSGNALIVAGGANFPGKPPWKGGKKVWTDRAWVLDAPDGKWRDAGKLPRPLAYGVSLRATDSVLCIGGSDSERHYADVFRLARNDGALAITPLPPLPIPLATAAGAVGGDGIVYVACGATEPGEKNASNRVFALDRNAKAWRELPPLPAEPRILPVMAVAGDFLHIFGGAAIEMKDGKPVRRYLRDAWVLDPKHGWLRLPDMPKAIAAGASPAPIVGGKIYIIAGDDGSLAGFQPVEKHPGFSAMILAFDLNTNTWHEAGTTPAPRATLPVVEWHGAFIFPSGEVRPGVRSPEVWSFSK